MKKTKRISKRSLVIFSISILFIAAQLVYSKPKAVGKQSASVKTEAKIKDGDTDDPSQSREKQPLSEILRPSIEITGGASIPLSGISDLYDLGFGGQLALSSESMVIPYTAIGILGGYYTYSSDLDGFKSSFTAIPVVLYLEPSYKTRAGGNFIIRPFARAGAGVSLSSGETNYGSYSSTDMAILGTAGLGMRHTALPDGMEILIHADYMQFMETESASVLNINLGVKFRFYDMAMEKNNE